MITIKTSPSAALTEWMRKEEGSYEDHNYSPTHVYAILSRFNGSRVTLTVQEAKAVIVSGTYHSTAWQPEEINGGTRTMRIINRYVNLIKEQLK